MGGGNTKSILSIAAPIALGLLTGGAGFALAPWFGSTATAALLGGATSAGLAGGKPKNWLTQGALGALGAGVSAPVGRGLASGWQAAGQGGAGLLGKTSGAIQGGLWGTGTSPTGAKYSLLPPGGQGSVGLSGTVGNAWGGGGYEAAKLLGTNMISGGISNYRSTPSMDKLGEMYSSQSVSSAIPSQGTVATVKPTPNPVTGWTSSAHRASLVDSDINNFDTLIPGRNRQQTNIYTW